MRFTLLIYIPLLPLACTSRPPSALAMQRRKGGKHASHPIRRILLLKTTVPTQRTHRRRRNKMPQHEPMPTSKHASHPIRRLLPLKTTVPTQRSHQRRRNKMPQHEPIPNTKHARHPIRRLLPLKTTVPTLRSHQRKRNNPPPNAPPAKARHGSHPIRGRPLNHKQTHDPRPPSAQKKWPRGGKQHLSPWEKMTNRQTSLPFKPVLTPSWQSTSGISRM